jgi:hypothetical protein
MKSISVMVIGVAVLFITAGSYAAQSQSGQTTASEKIASAFLPVTKWEFTPVVDGKEVIHDFLIQNKGNAPLNISKVKTG